MTPLLKKLRYRAGMRVAVIGAPAGFEAEIAREPGITRAGPRAKELDLIQAFFTRSAQFERSVRSLKDALGSGGILWIGYPKAKALGTDLNRDTLRASAARAGLRAVALVSIDPVWSALRLSLHPQQPEGSIPKKKRRSAR